MGIGRQRDGQADRYQYRADSIKADRQTIVRAGSESMGHNNNARQSAYCAGVAAKKNEIKAFK